MTKLLILLALVFALPLHAFDDQKFLDALAEIETGNRHHAVGKSHERSAFQISRAVWESHTTEPFYKASRESHYLISRNIALKHLKWIKATLTQHGRLVTVESCALCWNLGLTRYESGRISRRAKDYAIRLGNIYGTL